jgi:bacteriorhodopsin
MADIDVVKKGSRAWLWVVMAIVLAIVLWLILANASGPRTQTSIDGGQPHHAAALVS